jgi:hypothetical protein
MKALVKAKKAHAGAMVVTALNNLCKKKLKSSQYIYHYC